MMNIFQPKSRNKKPLHRDNLIIHILKIRPLARRKPPYLAGCCNTFVPLVYRIGMRIYST